MPIDAAIRCVFRNGDAPTKVMIVIIAICTFVVVVIVAVVDNDDGGGVLPASILL